MHGDSTWYFDESLGLYAISHDCCHGMNMAFQSRFERSSCLQCLFHVRARRPTFSSGKVLWSLYDSNRAFWLEPQSTQSLSHVRPKSLLPDSTTTRSGRPTVPRRRFADLTRSNPRPKGIQTKPPGPHFANPGLSLSPRHMSNSFSRPEFPLVSPAPSRFGGHMPKNLRAFVLVRPFVQALIHT
ncbi:hypothetical protein LZ30DRAFT_723611 [Colletotrichum cereale]|nr:hypothetical protein LZ30DRAFT_723611 [Colletotrichum cereale]